MSLLLDTHAVLWYALQDARLSAAARIAIENEPEKVFVSPASYWEIAIKISVGQYTLLEPFAVFWERAISQEGLALLPIEIRHAAKIIELPSIHRDPFDRLLVAQALTEKLSLVSNDSLLDRYCVPRIW